VIARLLPRFVRKIRLIAASDLAIMDKFRYLRDLAAQYLNPGARRTKRRDYRLRNGGSIVLRANSSDAKVFGEIFLEKVYSPYARAYARSAGRSTPVILVDLGANIGLSVIALDKELQPQTIVAVEPDSGNFLVLQENLRRTQLTDKCTALRAFAGAERGFAELVDSGNGAWGMRMGVASEAGLPVLPLSEIIGMASGLAVCENEVVVKCDVEGAELHLFRDLRQWEERVGYIILELHTEFLSAAEFHACLEASRYHWRMDGEIPTGAVLAVIGLKRLAAKAPAHIRQAAHSS
jgi:FkbM family methyltransferase